MRRILLIATIFIAFLPTLSSAQDSALTGTISTQTNSQTDADIATTIREILNELGNYTDVTVQVSDGIVTLRGEANSMTETQALDQLVARVEGVVAIKNEVTETADLAERLTPAWERFKTRAVTLLVQLPLALIALGAWGLIYYIGTRIARLKGPFERLAPNAFIADLIRSVVKIVFFIVGLVVALDILNATALLSTILGAAGIVGLAIGFAVRDTVENFIASVLLSIRQPFGPNDVVEINGDEGKVIRLTSRATILLSFDGNHIRIPNSTVFKSRIVNFSKNAERRFLFTITIDSASDLEQVRQLSEDIVRDLPFILDRPAVSSWLGDLTDAGMELSVTGWIDQGVTSIAHARGEALRKVKFAIESMGVALPNTTYHIEMKSSLSSSAVTEAEANHPVSPPMTSDAPVEERDSDLDEFIEEERADEDAEDLLSEEAPKE